MNYRIMRHVLYLLRLFQCFINNIYIYIQIPITQDFTQIYKEQEKNILDKYVKRDTLEADTTNKKIGQESAHLSRLALRYNSGSIQQNRQDNNSSTTNNTNTQKKQTKWIDCKTNKKDIKNLDMSEDKNNYEQVIPNPNMIEDTTNNKTITAKKDNYWILKEDKNQYDKITNTLTRISKKLLPTSTIEANDAEVVCSEQYKHLISKNVTPNISNEQINYIKEGMVGRKKSYFTSQHNEMRNKQEETINNVLMPKNEQNIIFNALKSQKNGIQYRIVQCGVNGVGKSTSLAKQAYLFLSLNLRVGVAACDTFRSGAIEQLRTHCRALNIKLYERGYGKDEASVCSESILLAKKDNIDVLLIDTAGRMQGNESLMKSLTKQIDKNQPDIILFVGEALVGNDGCDQLINFNRCMKEYSTNSYPHTIDGIILTKVDTIDEKIGTAISMSYSTGIPIVFLGVGQTYKDLKVPSASSIASIQLH